MLIETKYGFVWNGVEVTRVASNDGLDKRKKFNAIQIKHENGDIITIVSTKEGLEVQK